MSNAVDTLLDYNLNSDNSKIILTIDEPTRTINYDGNLILGVKGDYCSERIYFKAPQHVYDDIDLLADTVTVYVDYKNAVNEPYIQECTKPEIQDDGSVMFSWLISDKVTAEKGSVLFNVCVKNIVDGVLVNEWHTTNNFKGEVLDSVDVSEKTPEVISSDTVTLQALTEQVENYEAAVNNLNETLSDVNSYIETTVENMVDGRYLYYDGQLNDNIYTDGSYGLMNNYTNPDKPSGWGFTSAYPASEPCIVNPNGHRLAISTDNKGTDEFMYTFPYGGGKVALTEDTEMGEGKTTFKNKVYFDNYVALNDYVRVGNSISRDDDEQGVTYTYSFPSNSGTIALTSDLDNVSKFKLIRRIAGDAEQYVYNSVSMIDISDVLCDSRWNELMIIVRLEVKQCPDGSDGAWIGIFDNTNQEAFAEMSGMTAYSNAVYYGKYNINKTDDGMFAVQGVLGDLNKTAMAWRDNGSNNNQYSIQVGGWSLTNPNNTISIAIYGRN